MIIDQIGEFSKLEPDQLISQLENIDDIEFWSSYIKYKGQHYNMDVGAFFEALPEIVRLCIEIITDRGA